MTDHFTIFPAIDLRGGKVVRLAKGDPNQETTYGDDPSRWAERWASAGAAWLHVVNLDGAFGQDSSPNLQALESILAVGPKVEFGGGLRDLDSIRRLFDLGVERVCLGTACIQDPRLVEQVLASFGPERVAGDIGFRAGKVVVQGWQEATPLTILQAGQKLRRLGLERCVLTEVSRDGTGAGIDLAPAVDLQASTGLKVVASGGVSTLDEIQAARQSGLAGIILGRALYEGKLSLQDCWTAV